MIDFKLYEYIVGFKYKKLKIKVFIVGLNNINIF